MIELAGLLVTVGLLVVVLRVHAVRSSRVKR